MGKLLVAIVYSSWENCAGIVTCSGSTMESLARAYGRQTSQKVTVCWVSKPPYLSLKTRDYSTPLY